VISAIDNKNSAGIFCRELWFSERASLARRDLQKLLGQLLLRLRDQSVFLQQLGAEDACVDISDHAKHEDS
jgi:hypothetical protein